MLVDVDPQSRHLVLLENPTAHDTDTYYQVMEPIRYRESLTPESDINNCIQEMFYSVVISFADCLKDLTDIIESENSEVSHISSIRLS